MSTERARNILVTASVSTLRLNVGDVEVCVDQLLVEHSETRDSVDVSYASGTRNHDTGLSSTKSVIMPTSSRVPLLTQAVISNCIEEPDRKIIRSRRRRKTAISDLAHSDDGDIAGLVVACRAP